MTRANIVLILADDLGARDLGCDGGTLYETPVLDRLAAEGVRFTDAYAAAPVCSPTRASLLTGKYPATVGVTQYIGAHVLGRLCDVPYFHHLPLSEFSLARALRSGGYKTWHVGKWHLGSRDTWPDRHGFDVNIGGCELGHPPNGYFSPYEIPTLTDGPDGEYLSDRLTDEAIGLIESAGEEPFFLQLSHYAVHTPIQAPEPLVEKYRRKVEELGLDQRDPFDEGEPFPTWHKRHHHVRRRTFQSDPVYAAMVENLDANVGRLLDAIRRTSNSENTIVLFTSDNGGLATAEGSPTCNAPLAEGKGWMYDGGIRVPLIIHWPGVVRPGSVIKEPVTSPDLYPTLMEAADLSPSGEQIEGTSLIPLLHNDNIEKRSLFWHYPHYANQGGTPAAAIREGDWKLIYFYEDDHVELYNLRDDISEEVDLSHKLPEKTATLQEQLVEWQCKIGALRPKRNLRASFTDLPG